VRWTGDAILQDAATLGAILDAYPAPSLVVDGDVRPLLVNRAARGALGIEAQGTTEETPLDAAGKLLHCVNAVETPGGCGRSPGCKACVIRNAVGRALADDVTRRARTFLRVQRPAGIAEAHFLVSAAPVRQGDQVAVILTLEDLSEVVKLTSLLPICFHCRKVRNEESYWTTVEEYFRQTAEVEFSHALCPECLEKHYPAEEA
jgi:PAS domain-containing protein